MFMRISTLLALCAICFSFSGCARLIHVTTSDPVQINTSKRSMGTRLNDQRIETYARVNLLKASREFDEARIHITSFNGILLLTGQVQNDALRTLAGDTLAQLNSVRQLHNELVVRPIARFDTQTKDSWITTKIKSKLAAGSIQSRRVKVITEANTVFLMGLVSRYEADKVTDVARNTRGVQQVVKVFEYLD